METRKREHWPHFGLESRVRTRRSPFFTILRKIFSRGTLSERDMSLDLSLSDLFVYKLVRIVAIPELVIQLGYSCHNVPIQYIPCFFRVWKLYSDIGILGTGSFCFFVATVGVILTREVLIREIVWQPNCLLQIEKVMLKT
jgi:hypothetical protein